MSIQPPNGILDITGATLRVSKMEFSNVTGFDTVLNNVARNTVLHVDTTEYTANVAYAVKPPNMFMAQFDLELAAGGTGLPCNFNYYNDSNLGTSFNGYNLSFNDTSIILTYDGGSALHTATLSSSLNNGVYRKVKVLFDRDTTLVSINGENVFRFKDELRPRTYDTGTTGYIRWWHNSPVARKIKNLKVSNGEKWAQEYDSAGLSSNISYTHGLVGVGTSVPEYTLDVAGDIRASGNLIVNGSNTLINTTSLAIEDGVIECGKGNSSAAKDLGFLMVRNDGSSTTNSNVAMFWDESTDALTFGFSDSGPTATTLTPNTTKTLNSYFVGNVGIGTASPGVPLTVYGSDPADTFGSQVRIVSTSTTGAENSGGVLIFQGHDGVTGRGFASVGGLKENGTSGNHASYLRFSTRASGGGSIAERMRITSTGNVGIGTASPAAILDVFNSSHNTGYRETTQFRVSNAADHASFTRLIFGQDSTNNGFIEVSNQANTKGNLHLQPYGGKVGIGTISHAATLDVRGASHDPNTPTVHIGDNVADAGDYGMVNLVRDGANGGSKSHLAFIRNGHTVSAMGFHNNTNTFGIWTSFAGVTNTPAISIDTSGNVGIGTASPGTKLQVGGNAETTPQYIRIRGERVNAAGDICGIQMYNSANSGDRGNSRITNSRGANNYGSNLEFWTNPDSNAPATEKMRITSTGNVGIGTASPGTKLDVVGHPHTFIRKMAQAGTATNDYNHILGGPRPGTTSGGAVHFINGSARTSDGGTDTYTIRNDSGKLRLGNPSFDTLLEGKVGIGTASPTQTLDVNGSVRQRGANTYLDWAERRIIMNYDNTYRQGIKFSTGTREMTLFSTTGDSGGSIIFKTRAGGGSSDTDYGTERMRITGGGNVGIGTNSPVGKLTLNAYGSEGSTDCFIIGTNTSSNNLRIGVNSTGGYCWIQSHQSKPLRLNPAGNSTQYGTSNTTLSDDRIKDNEVYIENATDTLLKLKPQVYDKKLIWNISKLGETSNVNVVRESGLITQDVWYDAPELRHLVHLGEGAEPGEDKPVTDNDPTIDPDYSSWGDNVSLLDYMGFIPYLIKSNQEIYTKLQEAEAKTTTLETKLQTETAALETELQAEKTKTNTLDTELQAEKAKVADLLARVTALENA